MNEPSNSNPIMPRPDATWSERASSVNQAHYKHSQFKQDRGDGTISRGVAPRSSSRGGPAVVAGATSDTDPVSVTHRRSGAESISFGLALILLLTAVLPARQYGCIMRRILL